MDGRMQSTSSVQIELLIKDLPGAAKQLGHSISAVHLYHSPPPANPRIETKSKSWRGRSNRLSSQVLQFPMSSLPPFKTEPKKETAAAYKECKGPSQGLWGGKPGLIWPWRQNQIFINEREHRDARGEITEKHRHSARARGRVTAPVTQPPPCQSSTGADRGAARETSTDRDLLLLRQMSRTVDSAKRLKTQQENKPSRSPGVTLYES